MNSVVDGEYDTIIIEKELRGITGNLGIICATLGFVCSPSQTQVRTVTALANLLYSGLETWHRIPSLRLAYFSFPSFEGMNGWAI
jgi:hypothetical protein